jgi:hypothetical protein
MEGIILALIMLGAFSFGFYLVARLDRLTGGDRKNTYYTTPGKKRPEDPEDRNIFHPGT